MNILKTTLIFLFLLFPSLVLGKTTKKTTAKHNVKKVAKKTVAQKPSKKMTAKTAAAGKKAPGRSLASERIITYSSVELPCTDNESWIFATRTGKNLEEKFVKALREKKLNINTVIDLDIAQKGEKDLHNRFISEYFYWRSFYNSGLTSVSHRGFNKMLENYSFHPDTVSIFLGVVQCMNKIHSQYPTLGLSNNAAKTVQFHLSKPIQQKHKEHLALAFSNYIRRRIPESGFAEVAWNSLSALEDFPDYVSFLRVLISASVANENDVIQYGNSFLQFKNLPENLVNQKDLVHLQLGRAYYGQRDYKNAIVYFKKVSNTSNLFTQAILGSTWSHLMKKDYQGAVGESENLLLGNMRHTFSPEANMVSAMAFIETCNYGEAIENIKYFRRNYHKIYSYLFHWNKNPQKGNNYKLVVDFLKNKSKVPDRIGTEWIRSPIFIANQDELNLILTENKKIPVILKYLDVVKKPKYKEAQFKSAAQLKKLIHSVAADFKSREKLLLREINKNAEAITKHLWASLNSANQNMQLVEAEAYSSFGEQVIEDQALSENPELAASKKKEKKQEQASANSGTTWDWGKFPTQANPDEDEPEIWEDELGFLRADTSNKCTGERAPSSAENAQTKKAGKY